MTILRTDPKQAIGFFLSLVGAMGADEGRIASIANTTIRYLLASKEQRQTLRLNQELETKWYKALSEGHIDWYIYDDDDYLAELWACWVVYSRKYLISIQQPKSYPPRGIIDDLGEIKSVVDLGCGIGFTTAALKEMFPSASVVGTNLDGMKQTRFAQKLGARYGFEVTSDVSGLSSADLVFASEYFEHIPKPVDDLRKVLALNPKALLIANTFTARAVGHFPRYVIDGDVKTGKEVSRIFNAELRARGYQKVETKLWNSRPTYWKRQ